MDISSFYSVQKGITDSSSSSILGNSSKYIKNCQTCSQEFRAKRPDARHCSVSCKQVEYRRRRREAVLAERAIQAEAEASKPKACVSKVIIQPIYSGMVFLDGECPSIGSGYRNVSVLSTKGNRVRIHHVASGLGGVIPTKAWESILAASERRLGRMAA